MYCFIQYGDKKHSLRSITMRGNLVEEILLVLHVKVCANEAVYSTVTVGLLLHIKVATWSNQTH